MTDYEQFKKEAEKLAELIKRNPDGRNMSGMWWGELDVVMRELSVQYFGNVPSPIHLPNTRK